MSVNKPVWVDSDDAPELTDKFFDKGIYKLGDQVVSPKKGKAAFKAALRRGRPKSEIVKESLTVRYDTDVVAAFRATGPGWQSRMNAALREWLKAHSPT